jgi:hypothetical protein
VVVYEWMRVRAKALTRSQLLWGSPGRRVHGVNGCRAYRAAFVRYGDGSVGYLYRLKDFEIDVNGWRGLSTRLAVELRVQFI